MSSNYTTASLQDFYGEVDAAALTPQAARTKAIKKMGEQQFPIYTWYMFVCIIGIATLRNFLCTLWAWRRRRLHTSTKSLTFPPSPSGNVFVFRLATAISTIFTRLSYRWRIPYVSMTMLEVLMTVAYILILFTLEFSYTQNLTIKLWANRAGHLAGIQFPLIVALSTKNNVIGFMTGVGHEKLNQMHRMTSRVTLVMLWVHLFGTLHNRGRARWLYAPWVVCGLVAGIAMTFLVLTSIEPIRRRCYEFFYACHMVLVMIVMVCAMIHCHEPNYGIYIWPAFVFWGFDRVCRYLRLISFNSWLVHRKCTGVVELATSDALRVTVRRQIPFGWKAGQHMFISFPSVNPLQSHPFTLASVAQGSGFGLGIVQDLSFVIRVRQGFTKSLYDRILETGTTELPILVDGPYGAPPDITPFSTCVFVTGGSGITYTLPRCEDIVKRANENAACARRVVFIWAIRDRAHLRWFPGRFAALASSTPQGVSLSIQIYVTSGRPSLEELEKNISEDSEESSTSENDEKKSDILSLNDGHDNIAFYEGRPDILQLLQTEIKASVGPVSVDASGPSPLLASVRAALCAPFAGPVSIMKGAQTVQLNVEEFSL